MVNIGTYLLVSDNSGAIIAYCLNIIKCSQKKGVLPGQTLIINVKKNIFKKHIIKKSKIITKGKICKALLIRSVRGVKRWGNFFIRVSTNSVILVNQYNVPYASRLIGVMFREVRKNIIFRKLLGIAEFII